VATPTAHQVVLEPAAQAFADAAAQPPQLDELSPDERPSATSARSTTS
jgi:hypothetical protein